MKLLDLNLLLYALDESSPLHHDARPWLERTLSGPSTVVLSWNVLVGFVRLSTRAAIFASPLPVDEAHDIVQGWLEQPAVTVLHGSLTDVVRRARLDQVQKEPPMSTEIVNVHEAKSSLSRLLRVVEDGGTDVVIARHGRPVARLVPYGPAPRRLGVLAGELVVPDDFDAPLPDDLLASFEGAAG
ncbi:MAG: type II toxin-antitoxin system prevent-host-death family antitoxin [Nitriliruptor sp.]|uniref:type II toxin-antitoxin system prevent-host-death family antitoxin n=1 Tax=Nitriliruptor sp. TaxID=2448056 RepID=UPI0034A07738